jgi:hypothetical protein
MYFVEQIQLYDELMLSPNNHALSDSFKVSVLNQAVQQIEDLRQVRITYSTLCLQLKIPSSFQGYFELLHKAATVYDAHQQSRSRNSHDSRKIYASNLAYGVTDLNDEYGLSAYHDPEDNHQAFPYYGDEDISIDTPLSTINVYAAQQCPLRPGNGQSCESNNSPGLRIPDSIFEKMSIEDKRAWFKVSPDIRRLLLERIDQGQRSVYLVNPPTRISSINRRVLLRTETNPVATLDDIAPDPKHQPDDQVVYETDNIPPCASSTFPGDLRRVMSSCSARHAPGNNKVNKMLTYTLKKATLKPHPSGALIDRGANGGGIAGADCRIIAQNQDAFVNIEGIDRHQVTNVPVVTCGAYAVTKNHGPVILIFHQLAGIQKGPSILSAGQMEAFHN